ncbi:MAG: hypothetical protein R3C28_33160 [Pirellulaceae bacterium]
MTEYLRDINVALAKDNHNVLLDTETKAARIRVQIKQLRRKHLEELSNGALSPLVIVAWLAALNAYTRVRDHAQNIAEAIAGNK